MIHTQNTITFVCRGLVIAVLLVNSAAFSAGAAKNKQKHEPRPNIILFSIDDLRADHLGCYGYDKPTTPFLDKWAKKEAVLFETAYSTAVSTPPGHAAMMTGMFPLSADPRTMADGILGTPPALWSLFREQGYHVMGFADTVRFSPQYGYDPSFKIFVHKGAREIFPAAQNWIKKQDAPYFLFVHVFDVHWPWEPRPPFKGKLNTAPTRHGMNAIKWSQQLEVKQKFMDYLSLEAIVDDYDEEIMELDSRIKEFFTFLKKQKGYDQTMICVVSDHGESFYDHGMRIGHGGLPFEEQTRVPFLIRFPGKTYTGRRSAPVSLLDLMPSMLDVAGLEIPDYLEGDSLLPLAREDPFLERPIFSRTNNLGGSVSVRFEGWKFIEAPKVSVRVIQSMITRTRSSLEDPYEAPAMNTTESKKTKTAASTRLPWRKRSSYKAAPQQPAKKSPIDIVTENIPTTDMLFNLSKDPKEQNNVIDEYPELAEKARTLIAQKRMQWKALIRRFNPDEGDDSIELSDEEIEQLKSVGYLQ